MDEENIDTLIDLLQNVKSGGLLLNEVTPEEYLPVAREIAEAQEKLGEYMEALSQLEIAIEAVLNEEEEESEEEW